jgi:DNA polymerase elongation subunit (family B)
MLATKFIKRTTFAGNDAYKCESFYVRRYANSLSPVPITGTVLEYVVVKGNGDLVSKMRPIDTEEEIDIEYYERKGIY